jgi:hypothetical protein
MNEMHEILLPGDEGSLERQGARSDGLSRGWQADAAPLAAIINALPQHSRLLRNALTIVAAWTKGVITSLGLSGKPKSIRVTLAQAELQRILSE